VSLLDPVRLAVGLTILSLAAYSDVRTYRAANWHWIILGGCGLAFLTAELVLEGHPPAIFIMVGVYTLILVDTVWDRPMPKSKARAVTESVAPYGVAVALTVVAAGFLEGSSSWGTFVALIWVPVWAALMWVFAVLRVFGGPDAKAWITIGLLVPRQPHLAGPPFWFGTVPFVFRAFWFGTVPFVFRAFLYSSLPIIVTFALVLAANLRYNRKHGERKLPEALLGIRIPFDDPPPYARFVQLDARGRVGRPWLRMLRSPRRQDLHAEVRRLRDAGFERAWAVRPVPLLPGIAGGYILAFLFGLFPLA
jgi:hypothetical protein